MHWTILRRLINRLKVGTPRAKWLEELKQEEDFGAPTKFTERNIGKCHETAVG